MTNGTVADVFVVYATTNPEHGHLGISAFAVTKETRGLRVSAPFGKIGLTTSPMASVYLEGCRVPAEHRLGKEGHGARVFIDSMGWERTCLFAGYLGSMERQLAACIEHAKRRKQFGRPLGKHQAVAHRLVDMKVRMESARMLLYRACWLIDAGCSADMEIASAKLAVSEAAIRSGLDAIQIHGASGVLLEGAVERGLRDAVASTIFSGTSEMQRNIIAARLGL